MFRVLLVLIAGLTLMFPTLAQDSDEQETEEVPMLSLKQGEAEALEVFAAYLLEGEKVELRFRSDYYVTDGSLNLEEGSWSLLATGLDIGDVTTYMGSDYRGIDLEIDASPGRCFRALDVYSAVAFRITCPLRSLNFEMRSDSEVSLLLVTKVIG